MARLLKKSLQDSNAFCHEICSSQIHADVYKKTSAVEAESRILREATLILA